MVSCARDSGAVEDPQGRRVVGVADGCLQQEAVELRLGEPVRSGLLDRVLGRDDHERQPDVVALAVDRDVPLLHDLEQRCLRLRAGAVDLVGEHDVGEDRPAVELELALALVVDADAGDVTGQQVGGELDAAGRPGDALRDRASERGLAGAGEVLQQQVPFAEQGDEAQAHDEGLAEQHLLDAGHQAAEGLLERGGLFGSHRHRVCPLLCGKEEGREGVSTDPTRTPSCTWFRWRRW